MKINNVMPIIIDQISEILEDWVNNEKELAERINEISKNVSNYLIAEDSGIVVGLIGFQPVCDEVIKFDPNGTTAAEIVSLFVRKQYINNGVGTALVKAIEKKIYQDGYRKVIIWSGPRYMDTGWDFYDSLKDYKRVGFVDSKDFPVWKKNLD